MKKNGFAQNSIWIISGQIAKVVITFLISVLTTRYLGPSNYGLINYVQSYIVFMTAIIGLGLNGVIIYQMVNNRNNEGKILGTAIILRLIIGCLCAGVFLGGFYAMNPEDTLMKKIVFLQSIQLPFLCLDTVKYWFQSYLKSKYPVIAQTIAHVITSIYKVFLLITEKSVEWFAFALSLDIIILSIFYIVFYRRQSVQKLRFSYTIAKQLLIACIPFTLASVMTVIYSQIDKVMIKMMLNDTAQVGLYSAAISLCTIFAFIPNAFLESARPLVMEAKKVSEELYRKRFKQMIASVFWVCFIYSVFICILSKLILFVLYGEAYLSANSCLKIAVWYTVFAYIGSAKSVWLICENKSKYVFVFAALGAITNVVMNVFLIPYWGINGAALATFITEMLVNFLYPAIFKETRGYTKEVFNGIRLQNIDFKITVDLFIKKFKNR